MKDRLLAHYLLHFGAGHIFTMTLVRCLLPFHERLAIDKFSQHLFPPHRDRPLRYSTLLHLRKRASSSLQSSNDRRSRSVRHLLCRYINMLPSLNYVRIFPSLDFRN